MGGCRKSSALIPFVQRDVSRGTIAFWSGSEETIPLTWRLCDGSRFTPNLLNYFRVGAGDTYAPADTGGTIIHNHPFAGNGHTHFLQAGTDIAAGLDKATELLSNESTGTTDDGNGLPPYHALLPIMYDGRKL